MRALFSRPLLLILTLVLARAHAACEFSSTRVTGVVGGPAGPQDVIAYLFVDGTAQADIETTVLHAACASRFAKGSWTLHTDNNLVVSLSTCSKIGTCQSWSCTPTTYSLALYNVTWSSDCGSFDTLAFGANSGAQTTFAADKFDEHRGVLVGGISGGILGLIVIAGVVWLVRKRRAQQAYYRDYGYPSGGRTERGRTVELPPEPTRLRGARTGPSLARPSNSHSTNNARPQFPPNMVPPMLAATRTGTQTTTLHPPSHLASESPPRPVNGFARDPLTARKHDETMRTLYSAPSVPQPSAPPADDGLSSQLRSPYQPVGTQAQPPSYGSTAEAPPPYSPAYLAAS